MCETESEWNAWQNIDWLFACCCCCCNDGLPADLSAVNKTHSTFLFQGEATLIEFREEHRSMFGHYICSFAIHMFLFAFNAGDRPNINLNVCLVFVISTIPDSNCLSLPCVCVCCSLNAVFRFNEILDSRAFMRRKTTHKPQKHPRVRIAKRVSNHSRKQTLLFLYVFFGLITFDLIRPGEGERKRKWITTEPIAFYIIRHTFSSTRQIK